MCNVINVNTDLYQLLEKRPVNTLDELYDIIKPYPNVDIVEQSIANTNQANILYNLTDLMFNYKVPMLYPFLYGKYVFNNSLFMIVKKPLGPNLLETSKTRHDSVWWAAVLYQIAKAIWYLEEMNIYITNLSLKTVYFQISNNLNDLDNIAIMITDFSKAFISNGRREGHLALQPFLQEIMPFLPTELQQLLNSINNYTGKNITQFLGLRYSIVSDKCSLFSLNKINGVSIGALFGNIYGTPLKYATEYKPPFLPIAPTKLNGYYSCKTSCIPVSGVFTEPIYHSLNIINKQYMHLDLYTLSSMWVYALMYYKIGSVENVIEQIKLDYPNTQSDLLLAHQFIGVLTFYCLNADKIDIDAILENSLKHFPKIVSNNQRPLEINTLDDILKGLVWSLKTININKDMWVESVKKVAEIQGLTDLMCSLVGNIIGALCGYKDCIPIQWGFTITQESVKFNNNISLSNYREIIANFVHC